MVALLRKYMRTVKAVFKFVIEYNASRLRKSHWVGIRLTAIF